MFDWILESGYYPIIIATKVDKIKRSQIAKCVKEVKAGLGANPETLVIPYSSLTKQGKEEIYDLIDDMLVHFNEDDEDGEDTEE